MATEEVKLLRTWSSPYALRIVWALQLKGIEFEQVHEDLSNKSPLLLQNNPVHKKVPVLVHNGKPVSESLVIMEYIEETWKQNPILPQDPYGRAMARFWAKFGDDKLMPTIWKVFINHAKEQDEAIAAVIEDMKILEENLKDKKFFGGETIGVVDITLGWIANLVGILEEIKELEILDEKNFPLLSAWTCKFSNDPAIKDSWPPRDELVAKFCALHDDMVSSTAPK